MANLYYANGMVRPYKRQPLLVALLVLMLVVVAVSGSYMLYNEPADDAGVQLGARQEAWETYDAHYGALRLSYPTTWSVSEAPNNDPAKPYGIFVRSPDQKMVVSILDNVTPATAPLIGTILSSQPAHLFASTFVWNFSKTDPRSESGTAVQAGIMTTAGSDAAWPTSPDMSAGKVIVITIQNHAAKHTAQELQQASGFAAAKRIAESVRLP